MTRRMILALAALALLVSWPLFAGGQKESKSAAGQSSSQVTQLSEWDYFAPGTNAVDWAEEQWNASHPSIQITHRYIPFASLKQELIKAVSANSVPDIAIIDNPDVASFAAMGALANITKQVQAWGQADKYFKGPWNSTVYKGQNYGVPQNSNTICLFWSKDLFEKAGLDPNTPPKTWQELYNDAKAVTVKVANVKGIAFSAVKSEEGTFQFLPFVQMAGASIDDLGSPAAISALQFWTDLYRNGYAANSVLSDTQSQAMGLFASQNVAMDIDGPWDLGQLKNAPFKWGVTLLPVKQGVNIRSSALGGEDFTIMAGSKHIDQAWSFIAWTQRPDFLEQLYVKGARLPSRGDIVADYPQEWKANPVIAVFVDQLQYAQPRGPNPEWPQLSNQIQLAIQSALSGQATPAEAMKRAAENAAQYLH